MRIAFAVATMLVFASALAGCAELDKYGLPLEQRYARLQWARVSVHQADAECSAEVAKNPLMSQYQCMRAKGWQER
jgi:hypothetical protein